MFADEVNYRFVLDQAGRGEFGFLLGTIDSEPGGEAYNVAALLTNHGRTMQPYRKVHLVPFGEYLPFRNSFPLFAMVAGELVPGDFAAGTEFTVMELAQPPIHFSALICFEDTLGDLTRRFVQRGAQLLINLTNDGWFLKTCAAEQHVGNALFRAVENRRPLIRCANTGVTCAIDPYGRVDRWLPPFERGFVAREIAIPAAQTVTFYTRHGDWLPLMCAIGSAVSLLVRILRRKTA
jgi:apolipoprotein N-acyltransferase